MEQPQTIGDDKQPDVEWDPPPALHEKFRYKSGETVLKAVDVELHYSTTGFPNSDTALGAWVRRLPENSSLIHTSAITSPQDPYEWTVIVGDYNKPDYSCYGSTPEEALRNLFQCMAGES